MKLAGWSITLVTTMFAGLAHAQPATSTVAATSTAGDALEAEIAAEMAKQEAAKETQPGTGGPATPVSGNASSRGLSNVFNPSISANGLLLFGGTTREENEEDVEAKNLISGFQLQEVELRASAIVDPYFRADFTLASDGEEIGFEEAYLSTLELPRMTIRAGQMRAAFGRHNPLHTHAFPFLTAPLPWRVILGGEGLADVGASFELLLPVPFYAELIAQVSRGDWLPFEADPDLRTRTDLAYLGRLATVFDLGDSTTLMLGGSYIGGQNGFEQATHVAGGDLTVKWKPIEAERYVGLEWTTEYLYRRANTGAEPIESGGAYSGVRFQFAQRWWVQARGAILGLPKGEEGQILRAEGLVAFVFSEFSALRLQYGFEHPEEGEDVHEGHAQLIFNIGAHPAHAY